MKSTHALDISIIKTNGALKKGLLDSPSTGTRFCGNSLIFGQFRVSQTRPGAVLAELEVLF